MSGVGVQFPCMRNKVLRQLWRESACRVQPIAFIDSGLLNVQEVMDIEQGILLEGYAHFVSKVEQKPELTGEDAKKWLMGILVRQGFQVRSAGQSNHGLQLLLD